MSVWMPPDAFESPRRVQEVLSEAPAPRRTVYAPIESADFQAMFKAWRADAADAYRELRLRTHATTPSERRKAKDHRALIRRARSKRRRTT